MNHKLNPLQRAEVRSTLQHVRTKANYAQALNKLNGQDELVFEIINLLETLSIAAGAFVVDEQDLQPNG